MSSQKVFQCLFFLGTLVCMMSALLLFKQEELPLVAIHPHANLITQNTNTYLGPTEKLPGETHLIRIQILIYNDPNPKGVVIVNASFDGKDIPLKPRDIYGYRGQASFQKKPGKYQLHWKVEKDQQIWPRTITHEEEVTLDPRDLWIQITITGDSAAIS